MAKLKTSKNDASVDAFLQSIDDEKKRRDSYELLQLMKDVTGREPAMWGKSIVGFGSYHYKYKSGQEGDWFLTGFSPRKQNLTLYIMPGFERYEKLMAKLGKHKTGKACLYVKKLEDVDRGVLKSLVSESVKYMEEKYGA